MEPTSDFLDKGQYTTESIRRYERVYGRDFISPGGAESAREFIAMLDLEPGARVLDAGCGIGGAAFLMASEHGARVEGIDLSANVIEMATARCRALGLEPRVTLRHGDLLALTADNRFDAVHSRDVFLHVRDKRALFELLNRALKSGGRILITDYCRGEQPASEAFERYVAGRGYHLTTVKEYGELLESAGFGEVRGRDLTRRFAEILEQELQRIETFEELSVDFLDMAEAWRRKHARARNGEQRWGLFTGRKPA